MADGKVPVLNRRIRDAIYDHVFAHDDHEVGGVLVGRLGDGDVPNVTGSIPALEADGRRASVTFTHDAWASIHKSLERDFPGQQIVGWYHSHPGFGIFLSRYDRFIHDNFFSDRRQIAYVVDPHAGTEGIFGWQDRELVKLIERPAGRSGTHGRVGESLLPVRASPGGTESLRGYLIGGVAAVVILVLVVLALASAGTNQNNPHRSHVATYPPTATGNSPAVSTFTVPQRPPLNPLVTTSPALSARRGSRGH